MFCYTYDKEGKPRSLMFRDGRGLWRDFHALLPEPDSKVHQASKVSLQASSILKRSKAGSPTLRIYGIAKDQAKVLGIHTESFRLPELVLTLSDLSSFVKERLEEVEKARSILYIATKMMAEGLLTRGERKPLGSDVSSLAGSFPVQEAFLPLAERHFHELLNRLPDNADVFATSQEAMVERWHLELKRGAEKAFRVGELAAGLNAQAIRSGVASRRYLRRELEKALFSEKETAYV